MRAVGVDATENLGESKIRRYLDELDISRDWI
jgi:hypothetical protein